MRYGTLSIKVVKSTNPLARDMFRLYTAYNSNPSSRDKIYFSGDVDESDLYTTIQRILRVVKHDKARIIVSTFFGAPIIKYDTIHELNHLAPVSVN